MPLTYQRKNIRIGNSSAITFPALLKIGRNSTCAANRLILTDPMGEISTEILSELLEQYVEPALLKKELGGALP